MKKISVIVPIYNCLNLLGFCVDSLCNQTIDKELIEIILVDDASTDGSEKRCREYAEANDYIKVVELSENKGQSYARNEGVKQSLGEYLFFADADDWLGPDCLRRLLDYAEKKESDVTIGRVIAVDRREKQGRVAWCRRKVKEIEDDEFENNWDFYASMGPWGRLIKRDLLLSNNIEFPTDMYMFEDIYWNAQVLHKAEKAVIINDYDYYYLRRDSGIPSLTTNDEELKPSIKPENLYISIDKLSLLGEEYGYGEDHPLWKRIFIIAVKDAMEFITYASKIDPNTYPNRGKEFKDKIWKRVQAHYSTWIKNNISTELVCRYDAMSEGLDFDYEDDPIHYYTYGKNSLSETVELVKDCDLTKTTLPDFLSQEAKLRLVAEQAESCEFYSDCTPVDGKIHGSYFVPLKVTDELETEIYLKNEDGLQKMKVLLKPDVWGEQYQESGTWVAAPAKEIATDAEFSIEFAIKLRDRVVNSGKITPWDENLGRPIIVNPTKEKLKKTAKELSETKKQLAETKKKQTSQKKKYDETKKQLSDTKKELKAIRSSYSWKVTKPLRKVGKLVRSKG